MQSRLVVRRNIEAVALVASGFTFMLFRLFEPALSRRVGPSEIDSHFVHLWSVGAPFDSACALSLDLLLLKRFSLLPFPLLDDPQPRKTSGEDHHDDQNGILYHWSALS